MHTQRGFVYHVYKDRVWGLIISIEIGYEVQLSSKYSNVYLRR